MKRLFAIVVLLFFQCFSFARNADTLKVVKLEDGTFVFKLINGGISVSDGLLVAKAKNGKTMPIEFTGHWLKVENLRLSIDLTISSNDFNEDFFTSNFPHVHSSIDTSSHYNKIFLGILVGVLDKSGNVFFSYEPVDTRFLETTNAKKVRKAYALLDKDSKFSGSDCENWQKAYYLFEQISWMTILRDEFSYQEYLSLVDTLVPCLGAEFGEDWLAFRELIWLLQEFNKPTSK